MCLPFQGLRTRQKRMAKLNRAFLNHCVVFPHGREASAIAGRPHSAAWSVPSPSLSPKIIMEQPYQGRGEGIHFVATCCFTSLMEHKMI